MTAVAVSVTLPSYRDDSRAVFVVGLTTNTDTNYKRNFMTSSALDFLNMKRTLRIIIDSPT